MFISKRVFPASLIAGAGLLMMLGVVNADDPKVPNGVVNADDPKVPNGAVNADDPKVPNGAVNADDPKVPNGAVSADDPEVPSQAAEPLAELVRAERGVTVDGQEQSVGAALDEGDLVSVAESGTAVVEYSDGCRYTVEGGKEYEVNHAQCICYENLDSSKHSRHDAVAEIGQLTGELARTTVDKGGPGYLDGKVGMELKEGDRVMVTARKSPEEGAPSALVEYYFGCDYTVKEDEIYTVDTEDCCAALLLPPPESAVITPSAAVPQPAVVPGLALIPVIAAGAIGAGAIAEGDGLSRQPISPN